MDVLWKIEPTQKVAVLTMARNDALYIPQWVAHYLAIGAEHLFIYSNDNTDGTDTIIDLLSVVYPVTHLKSSAARGVSIQCKTYEYSLFFLPELRQFQWKVWFTLMKLL